MLKYLFAIAILSGCSQQSTAPQTLDDSIRITAARLELVTNQENQLLRQGLPVGSLEDSALTYSDQLSEYYHRKGEK